MFKMLEFTPETYTTEFECIFCCDKVYMNYTTQSRVLPNKKTICKNCWDKEKYIKEYRYSKTLSWTQFPRFGDNVYYRNIYKRRLRMLRSRTTERWVKKNSVYTGRKYSHKEIWNAIRKSRLGSIIYRNMNNKEFWMLMMDDDIYYTMLLVHALYLGVL